MAQATAQTLDVDERRAVRVATRLPAGLRCDKAPTQQVIVTDMTNNGCRITIDRRVTVGTFVTVTVPDFIEISGWVAWSSQTALGVDFSHPLPDAVRAHVVALGLLA
jgi:hypothetical protein